jgi:hypothetical protein
LKDLPATGVPISGIEVLSNDSGSECADSPAGIGRAMVKAMGG